MCADAAPPAAPRSPRAEHEKLLQSAIKAQARAETVAEAAKIRAESAEAKARAAPKAAETEGAPPGAAESAEGFARELQWKIGEWAFGAPERAWESAEGFARELAPKAREASKRAFGTLGSASEKLGKAGDKLSSSAARAAKAARGVEARLGGAAKAWLHDIKSAAAQTPVG